MSSSGKIFMLDDDGIILDLYQELFEAKGYDVFATTNAYKLLMYAKEITPDIFLLDVNMPGLSGWEVLQMINKDETLRKIPVVMLSVSHDIDLAIAKGAAHFLNKPLEIDKLMEIVESYCQGNKKIDVLLLEDFASLMAPLERSIIEHNLKYFAVHDLRAAQRYLSKNKPKIVCISYENLDFEAAKSLLNFPKIYQANKNSNIQDFLK